MSFEFQQDVMRYAEIMGEKENGCEIICVSNPGHKWLMGHKWAMGGLWAMGLSELCLIFVQVQTLSIDCPINYKSLSNT